MLYVPVPTRPPTPSPRSRELADLLAKVVEEYQRAHPSVTRGEIRNAMRLAQMSAGPDRSRTALIASLVLGVGVAVLMTFMLLFEREGGAEVGSLFPVIAFVVIALLLVVFVILRMQSR